MTESKYKYLYLILIRTIILSFYWILQYIYIKELFLGTTIHSIISVYSFIAIIQNHLDERKTHYHIKKYYPHILILLFNLWLLVFPFIIVIAKYNIATTQSLRFDAIKYYITSFCIIFIGFGWLLLKDYFDKKIVYIFWETLIIIINMAIFLATPISLEYNTTRLYDYIIYNLHKIDLSYIIFIINALIIINILFTRYLNFISIEASFILSLFNALLIFIYGFSIEHMLGDYGYLYYTIVSLISLCIIYINIELLGEFDVKKKYWWITGKK